LSDKNEQSWDVEEIAKIPESATFLSNDARLRVADIDNNGGLDLILAPVSGKNTNGALLWLKDDKGDFVALDHPSGSPLVFDSADTNNNGHLDLLGLTADGQALQAINHGTKNYHWQTVRPHGV